jgi:hypothetical protein
MVEVIAVRIVNISHSRVWTMGGLVAVHVTLSLSLFVFLFPPLSLSLSATRVRGKGVGGEFFPERRRGIKRASGRVAFVFQGKFFGRGYNRRNLEGFLNRNSYGLGSYMLDGSVTYCMLGVVLR